MDNTYHLNVIRTHFARSVVAHYEEVYKEMRDTFDGLVHDTGRGGEPSSEEENALLDYDT